jgi:hypothetical protein
MSNKNKKATSQSFGFRAKTDSDIYDWIKSQKNLTNSLHSLIQSAITQYGIKDVRDAASDFAFGIGVPNTPQRTVPEPDIQQSAKTQTQLELEEMERQMALMEQKRKALLNETEDEPTTDDVARPKPVTKSNRRSLRGMISENVND